ncbi:LAFE_0D08372g1_1 [Lachancea fermentati]|uniref:LAFE_0D08372g1_1 n=1 Tax=Lachancea fermentati TaxID=4955 RepID=A0A1G4MC44_LACFM|nr:LAFE_0D08372g1_1 [Lachancea fermentati]
MYTDAHFQHHHFARAHYALYLDWNHDRFPAPDQPAAQPARPDSALRINPFWDYFQDDDDWDLFHSLQVDCNGQLTAAPPLAATATPLGSLFAARRAKPPAWRDLGTDELR